MKKLDIKRRLVEECVVKLNELIEIQLNAMNDAQDSANLHKGAMESRYDTFKEEAQRTRDAHAKQLSNYLQLQSTMQSYQINIHSTVKFGSVIVCEKIRFFIFSNVFDRYVTIKGKDYLSISLLSPLGKLLNNKTIGDEILIMNRRETILDIF